VFIGIEIDYSLDPRRGNWNFGCHGNLAGARVAEEGGGQNARATVARAFCPEPFH